MQIHLNTSKDNHQRIQELTRKWKLGTENHIARIALTYSLAKGIKLNLLETKDSKGKEYKENILFGKYRDFYIALMCQHYKVHKSDPNLSKYFKLHIDDGIESIWTLTSNNPTYTEFDFFSDQIEKGVNVLKGLDVSLDYIENKFQKYKKDFYRGTIELEIGHTVSDGQPVIVEVNNVNVYNNCHMAVAGSSGTGKTQFALHLLQEFHKKSQGAVKFAYLDFKGLKKGEESSPYYKPFFDATQTKFIKAPHNPFPFNPLTFIDIINETNRIMGINKFVDIISKYNNLGKSQVQVLKDATKEAFDNAKPGEYPSLQSIYERLLDVYGDKRDSLTEIMERITEIRLFDDDRKAEKEIVNDNYYFSLSGDFPESIRFTAVFLTINYIYNVFMNMENAPVEDGKVALRYVLLIDEAHVLFKNKKAQDILEKVLREIRSKGVVVVMLSQGIEEFNQPSFDFSSMCEMSFLLYIKDLDKKSVRTFLGLAENEVTTVIRSMEKPQKAKAATKLAGKLYSLTLKQHTNYDQT